MTEVSVVQACPGDVELLVALMGEFYGESGFPLDALRARRSFEELVRQPVRGHAYLVHAAGTVAGYLVLTLRFSVEYGGLAAFLDDLYLRPAFRGGGVGTVSLERALEAARGLGVRAVHLEVGRDNAAALGLYRKLGFADNDRQLLTLPLREPLHETSADGS